MAIRHARGPGRLTRKTDLRRHRHRQHLIGDRPDGRRSIAASLFYRAVGGGGDDPSTGTRAVARASSYAVVGALENTAHEGPTVNLREAAWLWP
jgi:hypothetical protein